MLSRSITSPVSYHAGDDAAYHAAHAVDGDGYGPDGGHFGVILRRQRQVCPAQSFFLQPF